MSTEFLLWAVNGLLFVLFVIVCAFVKVLWDMLQKTRDDLNQLALNVARNYLMKNDQMLQQILDRLQTIDQKLDRKVDKE